MVILNLVDPKEYSKPFYNLLVFREESNWNLLILVLKIMLFAICFNFYDFCILIIESKTLKLLICIFGKSIGGRESLAILSICSKDLLKTP